MNNKTIIESLSMDLLRVALGYHRGSNNMARRFSDEALLRISEINKSSVKPYFVEILTKIEYTLNISDTEKIAEDALMYSTLCKNYSNHYC